MVANANIAMWTVKWDFNFNFNNSSSFDTLLIVVQKSTDEGAVVLVGEIHVRTPELLAHLDLQDTTPQARETLAAML